MRPVEDIIGDANLGPLFRQRAASPEAARPAARATVPGAKQAAREAVAPHLNALQAKVLAGITAHGPATRDTLCEVLAMNPNTLRPRITELLAAKCIEVVAYTSDHPRRELLALARPLTPEETAP